MLATLLSAALVCAAALVLGQGVLRLCGVRAWSWLAGPVGLSALMLLAVPALHAPGRSTTMGVTIGLATVAGIVLMVREPALRPPWRGLVAGLPVLGLTLVPFIVAGRAGTLGVSFDNDMATHLLWAEAHVSSKAMDLNSVGPSYPLGPHALVAAMATPLGISVDLAFSGFIMALPVLLGWTALAALRRAGWLASAVTATLVGMPFIVAGYYGEGSFKEIMMAVLTLGLALLLATPLARSAWRWVPAGVLVAGMVSVYSYTSGLWAALFFAAWLVVLAARELLRGAGGGRRIVAAARIELLPLALATAVTLVVLVPQLPRVYRFVKASGGGTGLDPGSLGNLVARLPFWESLGIWHNADFRLAPADALTAGAWAGLMLALVLAGLWWWLRRGDWVLALSAVVAFLIWVYTDRTQAPYAAAKALVILAPYLMLLAVRPLVERDGWSLLPSWFAIAGPLLAAVLILEAGGSSWAAVRHSNVGPRDHMLQLRALRSSMDGGDVLYLGNDDFLRWNLPDVRVHAGVIAIADVPMRPEKKFVYGSAIDIDSFPAEFVNRWPWVIAPRDPVASAMPPQLKLVRTTKDFALYRRVAPVTDRPILDEGQDPGKVLDCAKSAAERRLSRSGGTATVRQPPSGAPGPTLAAGGSATVSLPVLPGDWDVALQYTSGLGFTVTAPGMRPARMSANLDRPGARFLVGRVRVTRAGRLPIRITVDDHLLASTAQLTYVPVVAAQAVGTQRTIPLRRACGQDVDFYTPARP